MNSHQLPPCHSLAKEGNHELPSSDEEGLGVVDLRGGKNGAPLPPRSGDEFPRFLAGVDDAVNHRHIGEHCNQPEHGGHTVK